MLACTCTLSIAVGGSMHRVVSKMPVHKSKEPPPTSARLHLFMISAVQRLCTGVEHFHQHLPRNTDDETGIHRPTQFQVLAGITGSTSPGHI